jgi:uncharacterized repeat protein (TIGR01451 family)
MKNLLSVFILLSVLSISHVSGQGSMGINVQINSGNPRFPFPQFLDYEYGKTLGRDNAEGVTDIEMERDIREAYQIMMNRAKYTGQEHNGLKYIEFKSKCLCNNSCTEGDGYALLAAAYMADKVTFDGLWAWVHDQRMNLDTRYSDCSKNNDRSTVNYDKNLGSGGKYPYGQYTIGNCNQDGFHEAVEDHHNTATDGDIDIAMALLIAYYQWGNQKMLTSDCGVDIHYKDELIKVLRGMTDTVFVMGGPQWECSQWFCPKGSDMRKDPDGAFGYYAGNVGFDGYLKSGNTWKETSSWALNPGNNANNGYSWESSPQHIFYNRSENFGGIRSDRASYLAPSYFNAFANFLEQEDPVKYKWNIHQYRRVQHSSDWLIGGPHMAGKYPTGGTYTVSGSTATITDMIFAEDARTPWRTLLNYVWFGNPSQTWNPSTHEIDNTPNNFMEDMAIRLAELLQQDGVCNKLGNDPTELKFKGVANLTQEISVEGNIPYGMGNFYINYNVGSCATAIVAYHHKYNNEESKKLLARWYRESVLRWDGEPSQTDIKDRYISNLPKFFHDWFRVLGLLTSSGNLLSPKHMSQPIKANLKIYNSVDKTVAYVPIYKNGVKRLEGDFLTYTFSYRNYASVAATGVKITYELPNEVEFVSASTGGSLSGNIVTWDISSVPGYTSTGETGADWETFDPSNYNSCGKVTLTVRIKENTQDKIICNQPTISASNSDSFTSNEFPNNYTTQYQRNCVDIRERDLQIIMRADRTVANNDDVVNFEIEFSNSAQGGWLNGGRPGVRMTYGNGFPGPNTIVNYYRLLHGADEAYINPGNYRVSYYLNDAARIGIYKAGVNENGWKMTTTILEGGDPGKVDFSSQVYTYGEDPHGKWNQRLIVKFADTLMATTQHTNNFMSTTPTEFNQVWFVHKGIASPFRMAVQMEAVGSSGSGCGSIPMADLITDDWSYSNTVNAGSNDKSLYFPISPSWFDFNSSYDNSLSENITNVHPEACMPLVTTTFDRLLVEEFDGQNWRRILGNGPVPGREIENVCISDTLPNDFEFQGFSDDEALGIKASFRIDGAGNQIIEWCIPAMLPGAYGKLSYAAKAKTDCSKDITVKNSAWIYTKFDSPIDSTLSVLITCKNIPPQNPNKSTIYKKADKEVYKIDDVIKYSIAFKQSDGTIAEPLMTANTDWSSVCGTLPSSFTGIKNAGFVYDYSHGTNGVLDVVVSPKLAQPFSLLFRNDKSSCTNGLKLTFTNNNCAQLTVSLYQNGTLLGTRTNLPYASPVDVMTIKAKLTDDKLYFWVNNENALPYLFDNITHLNPGYVGFQSPGTEPHTLSYWKTNFDSGFDVSLTDYLPAEVDFATASQSVLFNQNGLYTEPITYDQSNKTLNWTLVTGKKPMLFGDSVSFEFNAKVNTCGPGFISNVVYANIKGVPSNFYGAQSLVSCTNDCIMPTKITLGLDKTTLCDGVLAELTVTVEPAGNWLTELRGSSTTALSDVLKYDIEAGSYTVFVADASDPGNCFEESSAVTVTAVADPGFEISSPLTGCLTGPAITPELSPEADGALWELDGSPVTVLSPSSLGEGSWELSATVEIDRCPFTASGTFAVTETPAPVPAQANYSALLGTENPLMEALPATGAAISWFAGEYANYSPELAAANSYRSLETALGKYPYYIAQQIDGCWSGYAEIELEIYDCPASAPVLQPADPYCPADASNLELASFINSTPGAGRADWFIADGTTPAALDYSVPAGSSLEFYARGWSDAGSCYGPVAKLELSAHPVPEPEILLGASICYLGSYPIAAGTGWDFSLNGAAHPHTDIDPVRDGISPNIAGNLLEWTYTDPATGCNASGSHTFSAALPDAPSAAPVTESEQNLPHPELEAVGAGNITWYSDECLTAIATGTDPELQFTETTPLWLSQEIGGCRSRCVETSITINPCGLPAPVLLKATENICVGDALPVFSVIPETGISYNWDGPAGAHTGETYTISASAPGPYTATVRAWDGSCLSPPATAALNVNALPVPTLTVPAQICSGQVEQAVFSPAPNLEPGTLFKINSTPALPGADLGAYQGSLSLEYTYQAAEGCSASVAAATEIIKIGAPSAMSETELLSGSPTGLLDAGQTVNWYDENGAFLVSASTYTHPDVSVTGVWVYKISVSASGCESPMSDFIYEITDCPVPAPGITAPTEVCAGSPAELQADIISGTVINWYAPGGGLLHTGEVFTTGPLAEGAHSFTARRTDGCEGAGRTVTVTAVSTPAPAVTLPAKQEICEGETPPAFSYSGSSASISWRLGHGGTVAELATGSSFVPVSPAVGVNRYSLVAFGNGPAQCPSPAASFTLTVNTVPAAPVIAPPADACYMQQHQPAGTSTGQAGLRWYFDAAGLYEIPATAGLAYAPAPSASAVTVYAASVENGCRSQTAPVDYRWRSSVPLPVFSDVSSCHDLPMPQPVPVNASPLRELQWQAQGASAWLPGPVELQRESATIRARFIDAAGCEGSVSEFTFNYINPPVPEISLQKYSLCEGAGGELKGQLKVQGQYAGLETGLPNGSIETGLSFSYYAQPAYEGSYKSRSYALMPGGQRCYSSYSQPADFALEGAPAKPTFVLYGPYCYGSEIWLGLLPAATARLGLAPWAQELPQIAGITGTYDIGKYFSKPEAVTFYAWTDNGCASDTAIIELTVNAVPFPEITASGAPFIERGENGQRIFTVCEGGDELPSLQAYYEGAAISWLYNPASPIAGGSGTSMAVLPAPDSIGSAEKLLYILRAEKEGCLLEQTIGYAARPLPKPRILAEGIYTAADTVCAADPRRLYYIENYSEGRNIDWLGLESLDIISAQRVLQESPESISASFTGTGTDTLMLRELLDGCADTAKLPVRVLAKPRAEASYWLDPMSGTGHFTNLSLAPSGDSYGMGFSWTFPAGRRVQSWESYLSAEEQASSFGPGPHSVWLAVYSPAGPFCHDSLRLDIDMPAVKGLHIPTALHPGSGGIKSQWKPSGFNLKSYEAWIFDSWGNLVWHSDKLKDGRPADSWSGTDKWGNPLKGDVYFYRIKAEFYDGTKWETDSRKTRDRILLIR